MKPLFRILAFVMATAAASADELIDYRILFESHADKVVVTEQAGVTYHTLDLGDGVINRCRGAGKYDDCVSIIIDEDGFAPDCLLTSTAFNLILAQRCETGTARQRLMVEEAFEALGETVARNAVPARDWADLRRLVFDRVEPHVPETCEKMDSRQLEVLENRLKLKEINRIQEIAAARRLPAGRCLD